MDARPWPAPAGLAAVSVAAAAVLVGSGVAASDVVAWFAVVGAGVMLPGLVVVRALRGAGPLSEDLAWSLPLGFVLALLTWGAGLVIGMPVSPFWTGVASVALLLVPAVRRRVLGSAATVGTGLGDGQRVGGGGLARGGGGLGRGQRPGQPADRPGPVVRLGARHDVPRGPRRGDGPHRGAALPDGARGALRLPLVLPRAGGPPRSGVRAPGRRHPPAAPDPPARRRRDGRRGGPGRGPAPVGCRRRGRRGGPGGHDGAERLGRAQRHHRALRHRRCGDGPDPALLAALGEHHARLARGARDRGGLGPGAARRSRRAAR